MEWSRAGVIAALLVAGQVQSAPIAYEFSGQINVLQRDAAALFPGAVLGGAFQLRLLFDDQLPNLGFSSVNGLYGDAFGDNGPGFMSTMAAVLTAGSTVRNFSFPSAGFTDTAAHNFAVFDGAPISYANGKSVVVEGVQFVAEPSRGRNSGNNQYGFLRFWNEHPTGTVLTGSAGVIAGTSLPTSLAGIGGPSSRGDFGFFWGPPDGNGLQSFIGGSVTSAVVVSNAGPNPVVDPWPGSGDSGNTAPGSSAQNPLLPTATWPDPMTGGSTFSFEIANVTPGTTVWIDPPVATGYSYSLSPGASFTQSFRSLVIGTHVGDDLFDVGWWDFNTGQFNTATVATGELLQFGDGAVFFQITGIEPEAQLDPNNPLAFVVGLSFAEAGTVTVFQSAITAEYLPPVPEPTTWALMLAGLAAIGMQARRCR